MAIDSRVKGATAERQARDQLKALTGLTWERVPASGALNAVHGLKGDLYVPKEHNQYCVEVKHYAEPQFNHTLLTGTNPMLFKWWDQTEREAKQVKALPLLLFKHNRSKWFCAFKGYVSDELDHIVVDVGAYNFNIALLHEWVKKEGPIFV